MVMISAICLLVATIILAIVSCLSDKNNPLHFLFKVLPFVSLVGLSIICANYRSNFNGYSVLITLSILPLFLSPFDLKNFIETKKSKAQKKVIETNEQFAEIAEFEEENNLKREKKENKFLQSNGLILTGVSLLLASICIGISGLYKGIETIYGFCIGISFGLLAMFFTLASKKNTNIFDVLNLFMLATSSGILLGQIATVLMYSFALGNIIFCLGSFLIAVYGILKASLNNKYIDLLLYLGIIILIATFIL